MEIENVARPLEAAPAERLPLAERGQGPAPERRVAIVGGGITRRLAPFRDLSWEIWGFSSRAWRYPRVTRWFEIHSMTDLRQQLSWRKPGRRSFAGYMRFMARLGCPVYMQEPHPKIPTSRPFPVEMLLERFGPCFTSTVSYLVALAIVEGFNVIGLWGIEAKGQEYAYQRPALRYLLAQARRAGAQIVLPPRSTLRVPENPSYVVTRVLYAYDWYSSGAWWRDRLRRRARRKLLRRRRA